MSSTCFLVLLLALASLSIPSIADENFGLSRKLKPSHPLHKAPAPSPKPHSTHNDVEEFEDEFDQELKVKPTHPPSHAPAPSTDSGDDGELEEEVFEGKKSHAPSPMDDEDDSELEEEDSDVIEMEEVKLKPSHRHPHPPSAAPKIAPRPSKRIDLN